MLLSMHLHCTHNIFIYLFTHLIYFIEDLLYPKTVLSWCKNTWMNKTLALFWCCSWRKLCVCVCVCVCVCKICHSKTCYDKQSVEDGISFQTKEKINLLLTLQNVNNRIRSEFNIDLKHLTLRMYWKRCLGVSIIHVGFHAAVIFCNSFNYH